MSKAFRKFLILWFGQLLASIGHGLTNFSLAVYVFNLSHQALDSSLVMLFGFLPSVLLSLPAGVLADKYDRRLLMILGDGLSVLGLLIILLAKLQGDATLWVILLGVTVSSVFSSLMQPAFMATLSDLLPKEEYTKATGMVQIANSAHYLIAPFLAGILLDSYGLELILVLDISTLMITVFVTSYVRKGLPSRALDEELKGKIELMSAWKVLKEQKGVFILTLIASALTFFMGFIQNLSNPFFLSFSNAQVLGRVMSLSSLGMLVSGLLVSSLAIKSQFVNKLVMGLVAAGIFMMAFPMTENFYLISLAGFLFFATLPVINACLDYLVRTNIDNRYQGRVFSYIGFISQMGFVFSYIISGLLADYFFTPAFMEGGILADSFGRLIGVGLSRGIAFEIIVAGLFLSLTALFLSGNQSVRMLEPVNDEEGQHYD